MHGRLVTIGGIAQYTDFGLGEVLIAKSYRVIYDAWEIRVHRGFSIAGKGDDIRASTCTLHLLQLLLQHFCHLLSRRDAKFGFGVGIKAAFTVYAIEGAQFTIGGQKIDP